MEDVMVDGPTVLLFLPAQKPIFPCVSKFPIFGGEEPHLVGATPHLLPLSIRAHSPYGPTCMLGDVGPG